MALRTSRAFTLTEIVIVIAIVAVLTGLTVPIWNSVRKRSYESHTLNSLRQAHLALELYRQGEDQGAMFTGTSSQMGLPNRDNFSRLLVERKIRWWTAPGKVGYGPIYYPVDPSDIVNPGTEPFVRHQLKSWLSYTVKNEANSVLLGDFNHTQGCGKFPDKFCLFKGIGVALNGSLVRRRAAGEIHSCEWWEQ